MIDQIIPLWTECLSYIVGVKTHSIDQKSLTIEKTESKNFLHEIEAWASQASTFFFYSLFIDQYYNRKILSSNFCLFFICGMQPKVEDLLPNVHEYLETQQGYSISASGLEDIIALVRSKTGLDPATCSAITRMLFHEIRSALLRGDIVEIRGLGKFYISSPLVSNNKIRVFPKFKSYKSLIKRMNDF